MNDSREAWRQAYSRGALYDTVVAGSVGLGDVERALMVRYAPAPASTIVNIGCGAGRESLALREMGYRRVIGVDLSAELLTVAGRNAAENGLDVEFLRADAAELPFETGSVDVATMFTNLLGYVIPAASRVEVMREAARILREGGRLLTVATSLHHLFLARTAVPLLDIVHHVWNPYRLEPGDRLVSGIESDALPQRPRSHWFRKGEIEQLAVATGFIVILSTTAAGLLTGKHGLHGAGQLVCVLEKRSTAVVGPPEGIVS